MEEHFTTVFQILHAFYLWIYLNRDYVGLSVVTGQKILSILYNRVQTNSNSVYPGKNILFYLAHPVNGMFFLFFTDSLTALIRKNCREQKNPTHTKSPLKTCF